MLQEKYNGSPDIDYNGAAFSVIKVPCLTNPNKISINKVRFQVFMKDGVVLSARRELFADPLTMLIMEFLTSWVLDKSAEAIKLECSAELIKDNMPYMGDDNHVMDLLSSELSEIVRKAVEDYEK